jgi:hypothetical protein
LECGGNRRFEGGAGYFLPEGSFPAGMNRKTEIQTQLLKGLCNPFSALFVENLNL